MGSEVTESPALAAQHNVGPGLSCGTSRQGRLSFVAKIKSALQTEAPWREI